MGWPARCVPLARRGPLEAPELRRAALENPRLCRVPGGHGCHSRDARPDPGARKRRLGGGTARHVSAGRGCRPAGRDHSRELPLRSGAHFRCAATGRTSQHLGSTRLSSPGDGRLGRHLCLVAARAGFLGSRAPSRDGLHLRHHRRSEGGRPDPRQSRLRLRSHRARLPQAGVLDPTARGAAVSFHPSPLPHVRTGVERLPPPFHGTDGDLRPGAPAGHPRGGPPRRRLGDLHRPETDGPPERGNPPRPAGGRKARIVREAAAALGPLALLPAALLLRPRQAPVRLALPPLRGGRRGASGRSAAVLGAVRLSGRAGVRPYRDGSHRFHLQSVREAGGKRRQAARDPGGEAGRRWRGAGAGSQRDPRLPGLRGCRAG